MVSSCFKRMEGFCHSETEKR